MNNQEAKKTLEEKLLTWHNISNDQNKKTKNPPQFTEWEMQWLIEELMLNRVKNGEISRFEEELRLHQTRYQSLSDFFPQAYLTLNDDGIIKELNKAAESVFGLESHHLRDICLTVFINEVSLDEYNDFLIKLMQTREPQSCRITLGHEKEKNKIVDIYGMMDTDIIDDSPICRLTISPAADKVETEEKAAECDQFNPRLKELTESYLRNIVNARLAQIGMG